MTVTSIATGRHIRREGNAVLWLACLNYGVHEHDPHYNAIDFNVAWNDPRNCRAFFADLIYYLSPSIAQTVDDQGFVLSHYAANKNVLFANSSMSFADIADELQQTILAGRDCRVSGRMLGTGNWRDPAVGINSGRTHLAGRLATERLFLMADGTVRWLANIDPRLLRPKHAQRQRRRLIHCLLSGACTSIAWSNGRSGDGSAFDRAAPDDRQSAPRR